MEMSWEDRMKRAAAKAADPKYVFEEGDIIGLASTWNPGAPCDTCGWEPYLEIRVEVTRPSRKRNKIIVCGFYQGEEAADFLSKLFSLENM